VVDSLLSGEGDRPLYIIGRNPESKFIVNRFKTSGIIDDYSSQPFNAHGIPAVRMSQVPADAIIINCSTSVSPVSVLKRLNENNLSHIANYFEVMNAIEESPIPDFIRDARGNFEKNLDRWQRIYDLLIDELSKRTLIDLLKYRLTGDPQHMMGYSVRLKDQYMEPFMDYHHETFVDIGGFDGDTTEEFCRRYPSYNRVYFFEPSAVNFSKARDRLSDFERISFHNLGLSDKNESLFFNPDAGSASSVVCEGANKIDVVRLDDYLTDEVTTIKMDIEGWELNALRGSSQHIIKSKPKAAIAVYHRAADFYEIPEFMLSLNPNYKLLLRHYTEGWSESVMYFRDGDF
jgi:FkbM family methyltransferase